jgi:hypothetical protein
MNLNKLVIVLCGLATVHVLLAHANAAEARASPDYAAEIKQLQQERIAALTRVVDMRLEQYRSGIQDHRTLGLAQAELLKAKLDVAEKPEERIAVLEEHVRLATTILTETNNRWKAGVLHESEVLDAKANLLDVKIRLLRERSKVKAPAK